MNMCWREPRRELREETNRHNLTLRYVMNCCSLSQEVGRHFCGVQESGRVAKGDAIAQVKFIDKLFGIVA